MKMTRMLFERNRPLPACMLALVCLLMTVATSLAQQVQATLSSDTTSVGEPVQLVITVEGARGANVPRSIADVDGLQVRFMGTSSRTSIHNMQVTSTAEYIFLVIPEREGDFTIPEIPVQVGKTVFKTRPTTLSVRAGGMGGNIPVLPAIPIPQPQNPMGQMPMAPQVTTPNVPPSRQQQSPADSHQRDYFGDLVVPKTSAYVGEIVPVQLRFFVSEGFPAEFSGRPGFSGDGFTVQRMSKGREIRTDDNGHLYGGAMFESAISAAKSGELEIPPATLDVRVQVPMQAPSGMDDFFGNMLRNFGAMDIREVTISTKGSKLDVKPLPKEGRPADFDGAVGQFKLSTSVSPAKAAEGEPITLKVVVSGRGNFDAMPAPRLLETDGWRTYDPSENFVPSPTDPIGFNGEKTFEFTLIAREKKTSTPSVSFSFFDPEQGKYVTLTAPPAAIEAAGSSAPAASPSQQAAAPASPDQSPAATPASPTAETLAKVFVPSSFEPLGLSPRLLLAGGILLVLWILTLAILVIRARKNSPAAAAAARYRENVALLGKLEDPAIESREFYETAANFIDGRLAGRRLETAPLPEDLKSALQEILQRRDEAKFSAYGQTGKLGPNAKSETITTLKTFHEKMPK